MPSVRYSIVIHKYSLVTYKKQTYIYMYTNKAQCGGYVATYKHSHAYGSTRIEAIHTYKIII